MRTLDPYQQRAITELYERDGVQAVMPMGSGKTVVGLTAIDELIRHGEADMFTILAPKRVAQLVWPREAEEWPHLKALHGGVVYAGGTIAERLAVFMSDAPVVATNVEIVKPLMAAARKNRKLARRLRFLCIDEMSMFKSPTGKRQREVSMMADRMDTIWGLTGTPAPNSELDQFAPLKILTRGALWGKNFNAWREERFIARDFMRRDWTLRDEWRERTLADIASVSFTVAPGDLASGPDVRTIDHAFELSGEERRAYEDMRRQFIAEFGRDPHQEPEFTVSVDGEAQAVGKLAQAGNGFMYRHVPDGERVRRDVVRIGYSRLERLESVLSGLGTGERALVVYEFQEDLDAIRKLLGKDAPHLGVGTSDAEALEYEARWNRGELPVLLIHPAAAGHGLNLQHGGSQLIFFSVPWSAELYAQVIKRIARRGQRADLCTVHRLIAHDTIDQRKVTRREMKDALQEALVAAIPTV